MTPPSPARVLLAVALPLLAILAGIVDAERHGARARDFAFAIDAYDPRDLLRGHFLRFRLVIDEGPAVEPCGGDGAPCCLCLAARGNGLASAARATCATARARCDGWLELAAARAEMRFWIPEDGAAGLEARLREATSRRAARAILAIDPAGAVRVRALELDGERLGGVPGG